MRKDVGSTSEPTRRRHVWKPFSVRIEQVKIDVARRIQRTTDTESGIESYFIEALNKWRELNLTTSFSTFLNNVHGRADSLAQVVHHQQFLLDEIIRAISSSDSLSSTALLEVLVAFIRDLQTDFEPFVPRTIETLIYLTKNSSVEVIESTFTTFALIFKHLSRSLSQDVIPTYEAMTSLLGKNVSHQKHYLVRFAAESLSFLLRRTKDSALQKLVTYIFDDLQKHDTAQYVEGVSLIFAEAIKGVERSLNVRGLPLFQHLVDATSSVSATLPSDANQFDTTHGRVLKNVTISLLHHCTNVTYAPLLDIFMGLLQTGEATKQNLGYRMVFISCAVRKGTRIADWKSMVDILIHSFSLLRREPLWHAVRAISVVVTYAPIPVLEQYVESLVNYMQPSPKSLLAFAVIIAKQSYDRFSEYVMPPYLELIRHNQDSGLADSLVQSALQVQEECIAQGRHESFLSSGLLPSEALSNHLLDALYEFTSSSTRMSSQAMMLPYVQFCGPTLEETVLQSAFDNLLRYCLSDLELPEPGSNTIYHVLIGVMLEHFGRRRLDIHPDIEAQLLSHKSLWHSATFLNGFSRFLSSRRAPIDVTTTASLVLPNLSHPGHTHRLCSLEILRSLQMKISPVESDLLDVCVLIETTDLTMQATRNLGMQTRKISQNFEFVEDKTISHLLIAHMFGLMLVNYTPLWTLCSETIAIMAKTEPLQVWHYLEKWLQTMQLERPTQELTGPLKSSPVGASDIEVSIDQFKCYNTTELEQNFRSVKEQMDCTVPSVSHTDLETHYYAEERSNISKPSQAIRILKLIPDMAEQHSRVLVPLFLSQFATNDKGSEEDSDSELIEDEESQKAADLTPLRPTSGPQYKLIPKDGVELLSLFAKFRNPVALAQTDRVQIVMMDLLASRDSRVQALAFDMLCNYRHKNLLKYEDNFRNLLSEARCRDEITTFLQTSSNDSVIQNDHRASVIPVVARILYGKMITRRHVESQKKGLANTRNIILSAIATLPSEDIEHFLRLFLKPFEDFSAIHEVNGHLKAFPRSEVPQIAIKAQMGFCVMLEDAIKQLGAKVSPFLPDLLDALYYCASHARDTLELNSQGTEPTLSIKIAKNIRQTTNNTIDLMFKYCIDFEWTPYMPLIFDCFVNPRLDKLPSETSQSPSGLLRLFSTWASTPIYSRFLVEYNRTVLIKVFDCLAEKTIQDKVAIFILHMVQHLCEQTKDDDNGLGASTKHELLADKIDILLDRISTLLVNQHENNNNMTSNTEFLELEVTVLSSISSFVMSGKATQTLVDLLLPLLKRPPKFIPDIVKEDILNIVQKFLPLSEDYIANSEHLWIKYKIVAKLFSSCNSRRSRTSLTAILSIFADKNEDLRLVSNIVADLNSYSKKRLDTPDFDLRLGAFATLNEQHYRDLSPLAWYPVLYSMIFFIGDEEELAIRTNAAYTIRRLIERCKEASEESHALFITMLETDLYAAIKHGMRIKQELIRQEWVGVLGYLIAECPFWSGVADMVPLLFDGDEEANFFYNIMHIQQHRRMRALRRLATIAARNVLASNNVSQVLLPMIEHYCLNPQEESHNLVAEAIKCTGQLAKAMKFNQYSAVLKRYIGLLKPDGTNQATVVRLVNSLVDAIGRGSIADSVLIDHGIEVVASQPDEAEDSMLVDTVDGVSTSIEEETCTLALRLSMPAPEKLDMVICNTFLPSLTRYLHSKDEKTVDLRIPTALSVVKLLILLQPKGLTARLPGVLTDICHVLRSRSQDARDMTRNTLGSIATLLGPQYFFYLLSELKAALQRGYQLHVLGFSVHTILVKLQPQHGALDYCLSSIVSILVDDIFGEIGADKEAEAYLSKMKELKSSKSYDSFEVMASTTSFSIFSEILDPLQALLAETSSLKVLRKIDEVLRRITLGLLRNSSSDSRDSLLFCYNVYQRALTLTRQTLEASSTVQEAARKEAERSFIVDLKARKFVKRDHSRANAHRLFQFVLDTLRAILQKYPHLQSPQNIATFVPIIGDSILSGHENLQNSAFRLLTQIIKVDLPALDSGAPVFLDQAIEVIKNSSSSKSDLCQTCLKFIANILGERKGVSIRDSVLSYLLIRIKDDLEEPERQGVTFSILKSIMSRKLMVPELYDLMDDVGTMLVTNQSAGPRSSARSAYYQFLLDYPQGKARFKKQIGFLIKNMEYVHATGRQSVMTLLDLVVSHIDDSLIQEYIQMLFVACSMSMVNDDEASCREAAALLLRKIINRAGASQLSAIVTASKSWVFNELPALQRAGFQFFGLLFEEKPNRKEDVKFFLERFQTIAHIATSRSLADQDDSFDGPENEEFEWQVLYHGIQTFSKLLKLEPASYINRKYASLWSDLRDLLIYPHAWIRHATSRLMGTLFINRSSAVEPLFCSGKDLVLQNLDLVRIARRSLIQLRHPLLSSELGEQIIKNLVFLLRFFHEKQIPLPPREDAAEDESHAVDSDETVVSAIEWLVKRIGTMLQTDRDVKLETTTLVRTRLLQFVAATIQILPSETLSNLGTTLVRPLYKYAEAHPHTAAQESHKELASEVLDLLKPKVGQTRFAELYNAVRQAQVAVTQDRKLKRTVESVRFPDRGARKRVKDAAKKRGKRADDAREHQRRRQIRSG